MLAQLFPLAYSLAWNFVTPLAATSDAYDDERPKEEPQGIEKDPFAAPPEGHETSLTAGGLAAPASLPEESKRRSDIEKDLDESDEKDSGHGLEFVWLNAEFGFQYASLDALDSTLFLDETESVQGGGPLIGGGLGLRLLYLTLGGRFRYATMSNFNLWSLAVELGFRIPFGSFEPYAAIGGGYVKVNQLQTGGDFERPAQKIKGVSGLDTRIALGLDYYLSDSFSVGAQWGGNFLFLTRPANAMLCAANTECIYSSSGSSTGAATSGSILIGLHF